MNNEKKDKTLRPRFSINKSRIRGVNETEGIEQTDFTPDKVLHVEIDDEITTVFDRVKRTSGKNIALVIPKHAGLLQSVVNLKILKKKLDEHGKKIVIVTSDIAGLQFAEKAGIAAIERLFEKENASSATPIVPTQHGQRPVRTLDRKVSISEIIRHGKTNFLTSLIARVRENIKKKKKAASGTRIVFVTPNKQALFTLILVSILLLLAIAYIALPGATIYITPHSSVLDPSFNVTFLDYEKNSRLLESGGSGTITIASHAINPPEFTKKITHNATGKIFKGENARGTINIINISEAPWELAERTRFQTDDGIIFRIPNAVRVPAKRAGTPGTLEVNTEADPYDASGQIVGIRGNIPPTRFFLPGIKNEENRKKLYGESRAPMAGGVTQTIKTVSEEDLKAAAEIARREIIKGAADDLKKYLEEQNLINKTNLSLLTDRNVLEVAEPTIIFPPGIIGREAEQFEVTGVYRASGVAFDREQLIDALKERLVARVDPDKKIVRVNEDDISYRFLDKDHAAGKIRLTATMRAIQIYELDPEKENGSRFLKKITDHIAGIGVDDAKEYLQQQIDEISRVEIKTWPIWAPTIPNIADNIKFVIQEENDLQ